jgi:hypothetical protein
VINLKPKLIGLESDPNYPKGISHRSKTRVKSAATYNILNNIDLNKDSSEIAPLKKIEKRSFNYERDYDIISAKYTKCNTEKAISNNEILKLESAEKFWKMHEYNPIQGSYFDKEKEMQYKNQQKEESKVWGERKLEQIPVNARGFTYNLATLIFLIQ